MSHYSDAKSLAHSLNIYIGRLSTEKDRAGFYDVLEDGSVVADSVMAQSASAAKVAYIMDRINR